MPSELIVVRLDKISLVKSPANGEKLILKGKPALTFDLQKFDNELQVAYGIVYAPNATDSQGDYASAETIRDAAYDFMQRGLTKSVDTNHDFVDSGAYIAESWIVKQDDLMFADKQGAWAVGIKVPNADMWADVKKGKYTGLSLAGTGQRVEKSDEESEQGLYQRFKKWWNTEQKQQDDDSMNEADLQKVAEVIEKQNQAVLDELAKTNARLEALEKQASPEDDKKPDDKPETLTKSDIEDIVKTALAESQKQDDGDAGEQALSKQDVTTLVKDVVADYLQKGTQESGGSKASSDLGAMITAKYGDK